MLDVIMLNVIMLFHGAISKEYCLVGKRADGDKSFGFCAGHQLN
jgi:hypothetical protein